MMTFSDLQEALRVFGLEERATLDEIKARHRILIKSCHPDSGQASDPEKIRKVNAAYEVLLEYLADYKFSFSEDEFYEQNPEARIRKQFFEGPLWEEA